MEMDHSSKLSAKAPVLKNSKNLINKIKKFLSHKSLCFLEVKVGNSKINYRPNFLLNLKNDKHLI